ncbi:CO/xanthine dehydrogenase Mo-binding subunit [Bradyrhizobium sp. AZCC 2289]
MGVEGIGASVVRKEDRRFITGKGRYVDDFKLVGLTHAHFIRSPHAHAKIKSIDASAAMKMPGVVGVLTGQQIVDDKVGNLICGWAVTSKDGSPMKMGAWPAMAPETMRFVGQAVAVVIAETKNQAKDAAEAVVVEETGRIGCSRDLRRGGTECLYETPRTSDQSQSSRLDTRYRLRHAVGAVRFRRAVRSLGKRGRSAEEQS